MKYLLHFLFFSYGFISLIIAEGKITCDSSPCQNDGFCLDNEGGYSCICESPFSGDHCEIDLCSSSPCKNRGECKISGESYSCKCVEPFSGTYCEDSLDLCYPNNPCENEGVCSNEGSDFKCECKAPYTGKECKEKTNTTVSDLTTPSIITSTASTTTYTTKHELTIIDRCFINPCGDHGICTMENDDFKCDCTPPYTGKTCEQDPCALNPCQNEGDCEIDGQEYKCICKAGFVGDRCEKEDEKITSEYTTESTTISNSSTSYTDSTTKSTTNSSSSSSNTDSTTRPITESISTTTVVHSTSGPSTASSSSFPDTDLTSEITTERSSPATDTDTTAGSSSESSSLTADTDLTTVSDLCFSSPCLNNGTCFYYNNSLQCNCSHPYIGDFCEKELKSESQAQNHVAIYAGTSSAFLVVILIAVAVLWHLRRTKQRKNSANFQNVDSSSLESENSRTYLNI